MPVDVEGASHKVSCLRQHNGVSGLQIDSVQRPEHGSPVLFVIGDDLIGFDTDPFSIRRDGQRLELSAVVRIAERPVPAHSRDTERGDGTTLQVREIHPFYRGSSLALIFAVKNRSL
ncbi:MAG: hypothetical protein JWN14_4051, partial [Chthonomonadales bacterium]|nr:hypothetical protein [Chthonomonadales bacterium]